MRGNLNLSVIKLGGSILENASQCQPVLKAIATSWRKGKKWVIVHGGGRKVDTLLTRLNIGKKTHNGLRITDRQTLEVVVSVLCGWVNKTLVADFSRLGVAAAGFSGADGHTLEAEFHPDLNGVKLGFVGQVRAVHPTLIRSTLDCGMLPIIAPVGSKLDGTLLNINADRVASALAVTLKAQRLLFLTDVEGLLDGSGRVVHHLTAPQAEQFLQSDFVNGGMRPKLDACLEALGGGVSEVIIAGPNQHSAVFTKSRGGTVLVAA